MYRLFLVDDESGQLELMAEILGEIAPGIQITCFSDPVHALEAMRAQPADVILSDIRMPGMDGLAFVGIIRAEYPDTIVAMLSAHSDFEYARQAITLGVSEYLVKPATKKDLCQLMALITRRLEALVQDRANHDALASAQRQGQMASLRRWLAGREDHLPENALPLFAREGLFQLACWQMLDKETNRYAVLPAWAEALSPFACYPMPPTGGEETGLTLFALGNEAQGDMLAQSLESLISEGTPGSRLHLGLSEPLWGLAQGRAELYAQATGLYALTFAAAGSFLLTPEKAAGIPPLPAGAFDALEDAVLAAARRFDAGEVARLVAQFQQAHGHLSHLCSRAAALNHMSHLYVSFCKQLGLQEPETFLAQLAQAQSFDALCGMAAQRMTDQLQAQHSQLNRGTASIISSIVRYLEENCAQDLSLESVAGRYHFNPSYLSNVFKQYTNVGFKEYLIQVRIQKAKKLLSESDDKIQQIARQCGYTDDSYFVRQFRKQTGLSPGQYRGKGL